MKKTLVCIVFLLISTTALFAKNEASSQNTSIVQAETSDVVTMEEHHRAVRNAMLKGVGIGGAGFGIVGFMIAFVIYSNKKTHAKKSVTSARLKQAASLANA